MQMLVATDGEGLVIDAARGTSALARGLDRPTSLARTFRLPGREHADPVG